VVTNGRHPVLVSGPDQQFELEPPPASRVLNPIGCGDCLAAGVAFAVAEGRPMLEAVRLGIAAAVENVSQLLPGRLSRADVERTLSTVERRK